MKKSFSEKTVLKESGVLLVAVILVLTVLTSVFIVTVKATPTLDHDVGVTGIISPTTGPMQTYPVNVIVKNFGTNDETSVPVWVVIEKNGAPEYNQTVFININAGQSMNVSFPDWYPSGLGEYQVTACTQLVGDENSSNDCLTKTAYITIDFMGLGVAPLGLADLAIVNGSLSVSNMGSSDNDGVWINLEDTYNQWDCFMENSDNASSGSQRGGRTWNQCRFVHRVQGSKVLPGEVSNQNWEMAVIWWVLNSSNRLSPTATVVAFNGINLVFYKEHIVEDGIDLFHIGYTMGLGDGAGYHLGNPLSFGYTFSSPLQWTWLEQGVNNLSVDRIEVIPENLNHTITAYPYISLYTKNITTLNITEMHAAINNPPSTPSINGPTSGKINTKYDYKIENSDIKPLYYFIDWGDGSNISFIGPYSPGTEATVSHTWTVKGTYTIRVKAMDSYYFESDWGTLQVTMPRAKSLINNHPFLQFFLDRFPHMFPILRHLMGLY